MSELSIAWATRKITAKDIRAKIHTHYKNRPNSQANWTVEALVYDEDLKSDIIADVNLRWAAAIICNIPSYKWDHEEALRFFFRRGYIVKRDGIIYVHHRGVWREFDP